MRATAAAGSRMRSRRNKNRTACEGLHILPDLPMVVLLLRKGDTTLTCLYDDLAIECFEAGSGLWHARIRRADRGPLVINGVSFPSLEVGFAWSSMQAAIADAKRHIDRFGLRWAGRQGPQQGSEQASQQGMAAARLAAAV
jgi:hypothetical protein